MTKNNMTENNMTENNRNKIFNSRFVMPYDIETFHRENKFNNKNMNESEEEINIVNQQSKTTMGDEEYEEDYEGYEGFEGENIYLPSTDDYDTPIMVNFYPSFDLISNNYYETFIKKTENNTEQHDQYDQLKYYDTPIRLEFEEDRKRYKIFKENSLIENWTLDKVNINIVMDQTGCNFESAIRSLINNHGDLVNAIMELLA